MNARKGKTGKSRTTKWRKIHAMATHVTNLLHLDSVPSLPLEEHVEEAYIPVHSVSAGPTWGDECNMNETSHFDCTLEHFFPDAGTYEPSSSNTEGETINEALSITERLAAVAIKYKMPDGAVREVGKLMRDLGADVPIDPRTILHRNRSKPMSDSFHHFGLVNGILEKLRNGCDDSIDCIELAINIDGLPLWENSPVTFWPILARILNCSDGRPFVVSMHCGRGEPTCVHSFLSYFIEEMKVLQKEGLNINSKLYGVKLVAVICDTPARKLVTYTKGHSGEGACDRCTQAGHSDGRGRWIFNQFNSRLRTDESFRKRTHPNHHHDKTSPFEELDLDMVKSFPLDYMHLVCLGVVKKLLKLMAKSLSKDEKLTFNTRLQLVNESAVSDFQRQAREIRYVGKWKATELRYFLLYAGPAVLKGLVTQDRYDHFILLHIAMSLLLSPAINSRHVELARQLLRYFVSEFARIYGQSQLIFNVHSLIHLPDDCDHFKRPLDDLSSFPFENYLGYLKSLIRGKRLPLAQIKARLSEISHFDINHMAPPASKKNSTLHFISTRSKVDKFCMIARGVIVKVTSISPVSVRGKRLIVAVDEANNQINWYRETHSGIGSTSLDIFTCVGLENQEMEWPLTTFERSVKCMVVKNCCDDNDIFGPPPFTL